MTEKVEMTAEERAEFEAYKAEKEKKRKEQERKEQRKQYSEMVDDEVTAAIPQLGELSEQIKTVKDTVFGNFETILKLKADITGVQPGGRTATPSRRATGNTASSSGRTPSTPTATPSKTASRWSKAISRAL